MTMRVEVPTGREVREHIEAWRALPEGERPVRPVELWSPPDGRWLPWTLDLVKPADDDTPQPGLRLVPLPEPRPEVGVGWREPETVAEARAARTDGVLQYNYKKVESQPAGWGRCGWASEAIVSTHRHRVPASWAPGRKRVAVDRIQGRTLDGVPVVGFYPMTTPPRVQLDDAGGTTVDATVIDGIAWVWVDPIEEEAPETERVQAWGAIQQGRMAVTPDGKGLDLGTTDLIIHVEGGSATGYIMRDDASHPFENRPLVFSDGTVEVLVESAAPSDQFPGAESAGGEAVAECSGEVESEGESSGSPSTEADIIERAWGLLANVSEGDWTRQNAEWQEAVERWRDEMFHPWLDRTSTPDWPIEDQRIVGILGEPESATPATDSVPTSAVAGAERASEVVGGGGGAGATTPTRDDPPEGWVVCRDREILRAANERRMVRWWCGSWSDPLGGWCYDAWHVDDDRFAVPVDMVADPEPWVPQAGDRVLVEAVVRPRLPYDADYPIETHAKVQFLYESGVPWVGWVSTGSLRPFPEDGEA